MSKTITFKDAKEAGIFLPGHYLAITAPKDRKVIVTEEETGVRETQIFEIKEGERLLLQMTEDCKLWGNPTKEELTLFGQDGFVQGPDTMHRVIRELYDIPGVVETAQSFSLSEKDYFFSDIEKAYEEEKKYKCSDNMWFWYWLASRYVWTGRDCADFCMFYVLGGLSNACLFNSYGNVSERGYSVRPEVTLDSALLFERADSDGSLEKPWKCYIKKKRQFININI